MKGLKKRQPDAIFSRIELGKGSDVGDTEEGDNTVAVKQRFGGDTRSDGEECLVIQRPGRIIFPVPLHLQHPGTCVGVVSV